MRLSDLSPTLRAQAERQLSDSKKLPWGLRKAFQSATVAVPTEKGGKFAPSCPPKKDPIIARLNAKVSPTGGKPRISKRVAKTDAKIESVTLAMAADSRLAWASVDVGVNPRLLPTAQQKGVDFKNRRFYTKAKVLNWERALTKVFIDFRAYLADRKWCAPLSKGVFVNISFHFPHTKNTAKKYRNFNAPHIVRPDCDNLAKGLLDAFVNAKLVEDDSVISLLSLLKVRSPKPMVTLTFGPITANQSEQLPRHCFNFAESDNPIVNISRCPINQSATSIPF